MPRARLLVVRRGGLGDTLLMVPVLRALARAQPEHELHFAGVLEFAVLLAHYGVVARALSTEDLSVWTLASGVVPARWRDYAAVVADDVACQRLVEVGITVHCFDPRPRDERPLPIQLAAQLQLALRWPDDAFLRPGGASTGAIVLAPGSGARAKCWPQEHWLQTARALADHAPIEVLIGPVEIERDDARQWPWSSPVTFVVEHDLVRVAARLQSARAFLGNDSGTTHLAAMLGVPTVAIFGVGNPRVFAPIGPRTQVVSSNDGTFPDVESVLAAVRRQLAS